MKVRARISAAVVLAMALASIAGPASAAKRQFTAQFFNVDSQTFVDNLCVGTGGVTVRDVALRLTNLSQQGPPLRTAGVDAPSGFTNVSAGAPTSNKGSWSLTSSTDPLALDSGGGKGQLKGGDWVQVPVSFTAPQAPGTYEWLVTAAGPGNSSNSNGSAGYTAANTLTVTVSDDCPPITCPGGNCAPEPQGRCEGIPATISGGLGDSLIIGTAGNDVIFDLGGSNHIEGRGGNDIVCTGSGNDVVLTLGGSDAVHDGGGQNLIRVGGGPDLVRTRDGSSRIAAGTGRDSVTVGKGRNNIRLGKGRDTAKAGNGADQIKGAAGKDTIKAGHGKNRLGGGRGNDKLKAGRGRDRLNGGSGRDVCRADGGKNKFRRCEVRRGNGA